MAELTNQNQEKEQTENAQTTTTTAAPQQTTQNKRGGMGNTLGGMNTKLVGSNQATTTDTNKEETLGKNENTTAAPEQQAIAKQETKPAETEKTASEQAPTTEQAPQTEAQSTNVETVAKQDIAVNISNFKDFMTSFKRALPLGFKVQMTPANWALICPTTAPQKEPVKALLNELAAGISQYTNINIFNDKIAHLQLLQNKSTAVIQQIQAALAATTDPIGKTALAAFLGTVQNFAAQCLEYQQMLQKGYAGVTNVQQYKDKPEVLLNDKNFVDFVDSQGAAFKKELSWATAEGAALFAKNEGNPIAFFENNLFPRGMVAEALSKNKSLKDADCLFDLNIKSLWDGYKTAKSDPTKVGAFQQQLTSAVKEAYEKTFLMEKLGGAASPLLEALKTKALF